MRALDHADDAGERGFRAPRRHVDDKPAIEVQTPGNDFPGGGLVDRRALARDERLIDAGRPLDDDPISRQALAGADQDALAFRQFLNRDFGFNAVPDDAGGRRREPFEGRQGGHGLARRPLLQPFAEQHEGDDDGGALEVEVRRVAGGGGRPEIKAEAERRGAERDQEVHRPHANPERLPGGAVKARAEPDLHGSCKRELDGGRRHPVPSEQIADHAGDEGSRKREGEDRVALGLLGARLADGSLGARIPLGRQQSRVVADVLDSRDERLRIDIVVERHMRPMAGEVDARLGDARNPGQRPLDPRHAGRAGHALDGEIDRGCCVCHSLHVGRVIGRQYCVRSGGGMHAERRWMLGAALNTSPVRPTDRTPRRW